MKKLDIHISDIVEKIDLKIFEEDYNGKTIFTFEVEDSRDNSTTVLKLEEKVAALIFEGLSHLFVEADDDKDTNEEDDEEDIAIDENPLETLKMFFEMLNLKDKEHFGLED